MPKQRRNKQQPKSARIGHHLKHWLIPHAANDHRPHLIRAHGLALVLALIIGMQGVVLVTRPAAVRTATHGNVLAYATDITVEDLFTQTNQQRAANNLPPLNLNAELNYSAELKAQDMFSEDYWAHVSPSGIQPWYWFGKAGYSYSYAGENLAKDFDTTSGVMTGWMNSPGHRANILNPHYSDVGFAVENGTLVGGQTTLVVAHYGAPAGISVGAIVPQHSSTPAPTATPQTATPAPTASPSPSATPSPVVAAASPPTVSGQVSAGTPAPKAYSLFAPLSLTRTLNWSTLISIALLLILLAVYAVTHATVWRKGLLRWRRFHYRLYAAITIVVLVTIILFLLASGFGQVS
jgi:uncharacterized integral membrane protein